MVATFDCIATGLPSYLTKHQSVLLDLTFIPDCVFTIPVGKLDSLLLNSYMLVIVHNGYTCNVCQLGVGYGILILLYTIKIINIPQSPY